MGLTSFFRRIGIGNNNLKRFQNFFFPLGGAFQSQDISDQQAIDEGYRSNAYFYAIVRKLSVTISSLPICLYEVRGTGDDAEYIKISEGELYNRIFFPNKEETLQDLLEKQITYIANTGDCFYYQEQEAIGFTDGDIISLPPQLMTAYLEKPGSILSKVKKWQLNDGIPKTILPEELLHITNFNPNQTALQNKEGLSPLQAGWHKLNASNNSAVAQSQYFENRGVSNVISASGGAQGLTMRKEDKEDLEQGTRNQLGGAHRANGVIVTTSPIEVNQLGSSSSDMQMIESQLQLLRDLCNLLNVPSVLFNDPTNSTYDNYRTAVKTFYSDVVLPMAEQQIKGINRKFVKEYDERKATKHVLKIAKHEIEALQPTTEEKKRIALDEVKAGTLSRNEYRQMFGMDSLDIKEMDIPTVQNNIVPVNYEQPNEN